MSSPQTENRAKWPPYLIGGLLALAVAATALWNLELPYIAYSPGPLADASDSVIVEEVEVFPPQGELLMITVLQQDVNVFEALLAGLDPTIDLVRRQAVRREGESDEEYRNRVLQQMDDSNFRSIAVALDYLGYEMVPSEVVVNDVVDDVAAASLLELGDTIRAINGMPVSSRDEVVNQLVGLEPGDSVEITVGRGDEEVDVVVELAEREDDPDSPMIGVVLGELTTPPIPLRLEPGDVGGPSAGLMHTLAIIDSLTAGEMTKGRVIAGTGTIDFDGTVGSIGAIRQKVVAAEAAGAEYIMVPAGNYETALTAERESIEIVPISNLDDAIRFLGGLEET